MKKILSVLLAALLAAFALAACGETESQSSSAPEASAASLADSESSEAESSAAEIGNGYCDKWFLLGVLDLESLEIDEDGAWALRNPIDENGLIICEGNSEMADDGSLKLIEREGAEVGTAVIENDILTLTLTEDFEWLLDDYTEALTFYRQDASADSAG